MSDREYVKSTIECVKEVTELFYQQKKEEGLEKLNNATSMMMESIELIIKQKDNGIEINEEKILSSLRDSMEALEKGDFVLVADILQYDFLEYIEEILDNIQ